MKKREKSFVRLNKGVYKAYCSHCKQFTELKGTALDRFHRHGKWACQHCKELFELE